MKLISTPNIRSPWLLGQVYDVEGSEYGTHHYLSMILGVSSPILVSQPLLVWPNIPDASHVINFVRQL